MLLPGNLLLSVSKRQGLTYVELGTAILEDQVYEAIKIHYAKISSHILSALQIAMIGRMKNVSY